MKISDFKDILKEKKLFSPGPVPKKEIINIDFSHRSKEFEKLYKNTKDKLRKKLKIPKDYNIIFTQGSGTSAIETVISSLDSQLYPEVLCSGVFGDRANDIAYRYSIASQAQNIGKYLYYVQFETSCSEYVNKGGFYDGFYNDYDLVIVDCVSGFGFYPLPKADIIIASSSKILAGLPVLGIVLYNKRAEKYFRDKGDYLNIMKYIKYGEKNQTPHTSLIPQFISLNKNLDNIITRGEIIQNCRVVEGFKEFIVGDNVCPVLTFKTKNILKVLKEFKKYNVEVYHNLSYMKDCFQISMFNYRDVKYYKLIKCILEKLKNENSL